MTKGEGVVLVKLYLIAAFPKTSRYFSCLFHLSAYRHLVNIISMFKGVPRLEIWSIIKACLLLAFAAVLLKALVPWDRSSFAGLTSMSLPSPLVKVLRHLGITNNSERWHRDTPQKPISQPQFEVPDANPFDSMRLICFSVVCLALCTPFFL